MIAPAGVKAHLALGYSHKRKRLNGLAARKSPPEHRQRVEQCVDLHTSMCDCCVGDLHPIGQGVSEMLDWVSAR
jgi:transposase